MFSMVLENRPLYYGANKYWPGKIRIGDFEESFLSNARTSTAQYKKIWKSSADTIIFERRPACFPTSILDQRIDDPVCWIGFPAGAVVNFIQIMAKQEDFLDVEGSLVPSSVDIISLMTVVPKGVSVWDVTIGSLEKFSDACRT